jgi:Nif-specific regulatory protein
MNPRLISIAGPLETGLFGLPEGKAVSIGSAASNLLVIDDPSVDPRHCVIERDGDRFRISDMVGGGATFVNGIPVRSRLLEHGDRVRVGTSLFLFLIDNAELTPEPLDDTAEISREMVGESSRMREVYRFIARAAPAASTVLISGESGTGKELVACAIHENSPRTRGPFVAINCAALTETLLESELFGHERGAFTGAVCQKPGKLEVADGGTVFLDEIAELHLPMQAKLLRVLQRREFERVGGTRTVKVDVRLTATNKDLQAAVRAGAFRDDLYYRLNVVSIRMPALRERREDIPLLANYFLARNGRGAHRRVVGFSEEARACLENYDWPGNVRELENAVERALVLGVSETILPEDLPETVLEAEPENAEAGSGSDFHSAVREAKREIILKAIEQAGGSYTEAARLLGLHPNYLHRLIRNLNLRPLLSLSARKNHS